MTRATVNQTAMTRTMHHFVASTTNALTDADTLQAPGHPAINVDDIRRIDKRKWDKKGIAYLHYEIGQPPTAGVLKLDDFAYERKPTDEMLERIEKNVLSSVTTEAAAPTQA